MSERPEFDPSRYLTKVSGSDYLEVKWRLLWLRQTHPNAIIDTTLISHADQVALFKATIEIPTNPDGTGGGIGTGHGSEAYGDFRDYIEKAETKALGRALAALGFGTQFCNDFAFGADQNRVVDSPVALQRQMERRQQSAPPRNRSTTRNTAPDLSGSPQTHATGAQASEHPVNVQRASQEQLHDIKKHLADLGWGDAELSLVVQSKNRAALAEFTADEAAKLIQFLGKTETAKSWLNTMNPAVATDPAGATQHRFIEAIALDLGITNEALELEVQSSFGCSVTGLNRRDASVLIERLQQRRTERSTQQAQMISTTDAAAKARE